MAHPLTDNCGRYGLNHLGMIEMVLDNNTTGFPTDTVVIAHARAIQAENDWLRAENKKLRAENAALRTAHKENQND